MSPHGINLQILDADNLGSPAFRSRIQELIDDTEQQLETLPDDRDSRPRGNATAQARGTASLFYSPAGEPGWPSLNDPVRPEPAGWGASDCRPGTTPYVGSNAWNDYLYSWQRNVCLVGLAGYDTLELWYGAHDSDALGGPHDDQIAVHPANVGSFCAGGSGSDLILGSDNTDVIYGQSGNDQLYGYAGHDYIDGGSGSDYIHGMMGDDEIVGGSGDDTLLGGSDRDRIVGGDGDDYLVGDCNDCNDGDDTIDGGNGQDVIWAGGGNDVVRAGADHDHV